MEFIQRRWKLISLFSCALLLTFSSAIIGQDTASFRDKFQLCETMGGIETVDAFATKDPLICKQWHLGPSPGINWKGINGGFEDYHRFANRVRIAILDSGIEFHRDLDETQFIQGFDAINNELIEEVDDSNDKVGHGTFIAGIIAQKTGNQYGAAGIASGAKLMPVVIQERAKDKIDLEVIANGINWAVDNNADVINISVGLDSWSLELEESAISQQEKQAIQSLKDAISRAYKKNVLVVIAAGNYKDKETIPPFAKDLLDGESAIVVASHDREGNISSFSPQLGAIDISAPGGEDSLEQCKPREIKWWSATGHSPLGILQVDRRGNLASSCSGTSMSAAQVSAVAAIVISDFRHCKNWSRIYRYETGCKTSEYSVQEIRDIILNADKKLEDFYQYGKDKFWLPLEPEVEITYIEGVPQLNVYAIEWAAYGYIKMNQSSNL